MSTEFKPIPGHLSLDQVAVSFGITIPRLRELRRQLDEGTHWMRDPADDRRTLFTPAGIVALRNLSGLSTPPEKQEAGHVVPPCPQNEASVAPELPSSPDAEKPSTPPQGAGLEEILTVVSSPRVFAGGEVKHHANPRVITARRANGEEVYVRVAESRHFVTRLADGSPMTLRARLDGTPPNWSLVGRCPRYIGRW